MKIACLTNDKQLWAIGPFVYLFNRYWDSNQAVDIVGFNQPDFALPDNFNFVSIDKTNWPAEKWTNQLIHYLQQLEDSHIIVMLEDYWLNKPVDDYCIKSMWEYAQTEAKLLRIDLTNDRAQHRTAVKYHEYNGFDIIRTTQPTAYQMSYQAAIWNKINLLKLLKPDQTPWQSEEDSRRVPDDMLVLGTRVHPIKYHQALRRNKPGIQNFDSFTKLDKLEILKLIPKGLI